MNIVLLGPAFPFRGGIAHFTALLSKYLSRRHRVRVITFSRQYPGIFFPGTSQKERDDAGAIPTEQLIDSINPLTWRATAQSIARTNPDLLIINYWLPFFGPCFGTIAALVRRWSKTKVLFLCHNIVPHERRPGDTFLTRFAFRFADFFIVQSRPVERDLAAIRPSAPYRLVPHPVYENFGNTISRERARKTLGLNDRRVILFFGYVRRYKGLHILLDAMPIVLREFPVRLVIAGEFYEREKPYREQIADLGLTNYVSVRPEYIPTDGVSQYFSASDLVVLPYLSATQSGIVQIAYQFDKPVVSTDVGGLSEMVLDGKTGFLVPPNHPSALADAIIRFYREKREREFVRGIRQFKKSYSWPALVKVIESLMNDKESSPRRERRDKATKSFGRPVK